MTASTPSWPLNLADPVRAVHYAMEPDCPWGDPRNCPYEASARRTIDAYETWRAAHRTEAES